MLAEASVAAPSITFAIPYYRGANYLARAIESVIAQRDESWKALVCDDSSEHGVEELVRSLGNGRVRYLHNEKNLGMAGNFNRCLDLAETDLVTLLHADDELMPTYCGTFRAAATRYPDAAALFCRAEIIGPDSQKRFSLADAVKDFINPSPREELVLAGEPGIRAMLKGNFIMCPTLCFRKRMLGSRRFPHGFKFVLDWELTTSLMIDGKSLVGLPDRCYRYRRHDDNATEQLTRTQQRFREESDCYDRMEATARSRGWDKCVELARQKRIIKLNVTYRALRSVASLHFGDARRSFRLLREL